MPAPVEAEAGQDVVRLALGQELARDAQDPRGRRRESRRLDLRRHGVEQEGAGAAVAHAVLGGDDELVPRRRRPAWRRRGARPPARPTRWRRSRRPASSSAASRHAPTSLPTPRRHTDPSPARSCLASSPCPTSSAATWRGASWASGGSRARELERGAQHRLDLLGRRRREHRHAGDGQRQGHVEDAVVARPVVAGDAGPVEHEDHRGSRAGRRRGWPGRRRG